MADVIVKALASLKAGEDDAESPNGTFFVILSTPNEDRDGEEVKAEEWELPLPDRITFDIDHGMNVASTIGSGVPSIDPETGNLLVKGSYASIQSAQDVRALVTEGHIFTTSVAFMRKTFTDTETGETSIKRELLNGAFVAIPCNTEAVVLDSKAIKSGARNSKSDQDLIQTAHDAMKGLGATCGGNADPDNAPDDAAGAAGKALSKKDGGPDPVALVQATDAALDEATDLLADIDTTSLDPKLQQAIALVYAAGESIDEVLDALGLPDPDEPDSGDSVKNAAASNASTAAGDDLAADDAGLAAQIKAARVAALTALAGL